MGDALLHLARGLVGEGHGEDLGGVGAAGRDQVADAGGQHARLARAGAGQHENGPVRRLDGLALLDAGRIPVVSTIATEKTRAVKMALDRDKITLSVTSPENGTAAEEVPGEYVSLPFEIGFNSRYLLDILSQLEGELVEVHMADAAAPTLIRESEDAQALYVLMPMRV